MRVATFNILHGRNPADDVVDVATYAAAITALDADVLALQEVDRNQPRSHGADLTAVAAEAMGAVAHRFVAAMTGSPGATRFLCTGDPEAMRRAAKSAWGVNVDRVERLQVPER